MPQRVREWIIPWRKKADLVQPLARKKIVDLKVEDRVIKMLVPGVSPIAKGQDLEVVFDPRKMHLFDQETERAIV